MPARCCADLFESVLAEHDLIVSPLLLTELKRILTTEGVTVATPSAVPEGIPDPDDAPPTSRMDQGNSAIAQH